MSMAAPQSTKNDRLLAHSTESRPIFQHSVLQEPTTQLPEMTTDVSFEVKVLDFNEITTMLTQFEHEHGFSTLEMFRRYIHGELGEDESIEKWFGLFFLYLGTQEVQRFSCP